MNFQTYQDLFESILHNPQPKAPYDNPDYLNYTKLNYSRLKRWLKHGVLSDELVRIVTSINRSLNWIVITEPWCGDASHIIPFIHKMAALNPKITVDYELRDSEPYRINNYLTKGGKSIPKLIIRDADGNDLATWGPRPAGSQKVYDRLKEEKADFETVKIALQHWYNENEGKDIQKEIGLLLRQLR